MDLPGHIKGIIHQLSSVDDWNILEKQEAELHLVLERL